MALSDGLNCVTFLTFQWMKAKSVIYRTVCLKIAVLVNVQSSFMLCSKRPLTEGFMFRFMFHGYSFLASECDAASQKEVPFLVNAGRALFNSGQHFSYKSFPAPKQKHSNCTSIDIICRTLTL